MKTVFNGIGSGSSKLAAAEMNYYTRKFSEVEENARKAINSALKARQYDIVCSACFRLMRFYLAKGNYLKVKESLELLKQYASEANYSTFFSMPDLAVSWFDMQMGNHQNIADWIRYESIHKKKVMPWNYGRDHIIHIQYLLCTQQFDTMLAFIKSNAAVLRGLGHNTLLVYFYVLEAVAYDKKNEREKSVRAFEKVYKTCCENDVFMPYIIIYNIKQKYLYSKRI